MNLRKQLVIGFSSMVLAGTLAVGVASASGGDNGSGNGVGSLHGRSHQTLTPEEKCARQSDIEAQAATAQQRIADRVTVLQQRRAHAETAGHTEVVARIDQRLARLQKMSDRIQTRLDKYEAWVADNCPVTAPVG